MMKNSLKISYVLSIALFFLTACGDIPMRQWFSHRAQVVDVDTEKPLEGVVVLARWTGRKSMLVDTQGTCYHVETATTDRNGWFEIPSYNEGLGKMSISGKSNRFSFYHEGYVFYSKTELLHLHAKKIYMKKFKGTREERFKFLSEFNTSCHESDNSEKNSYRIHKALYKEASALAKTSKDLRTLDFMLFKVEMSTLGFEEAHRRFNERHEAKE